MATYRDIKGDPIETVATDPSNPLEGDIWYNTTSGTLKGLGFQSAAWASGGNLLYLVVNHNQVNHLRLIQKHMMGLLGLK